MRASFVRQAGKTASSARASKASASPSTSKPAKEGVQLLTQHLNKNTLPYGLYTRALEIGNTQRPEIVNVASIQTEGGEATASAREEPVPKRGVTVAKGGNRKKTLYDHLAALPYNGIGARVRQLRWAENGLDVPADKPLAGPFKSAADEAKAIREQGGHGCYWYVTRSRIHLALSDLRPHGKVWGIKYWRGKRVTPEGKDEQIRHGLKYSWDAALEF